MKNSFKKVYHVIMSCRTVEQTETAIQWIDRVDSLNDDERFELRIYAEDVLNYLACEKERKSVT